MKKSNIIALAGILLSIAVFFHSFLLSGKLPIPSDTIVGLYSPFRDALAQEYPRGIPYKNFLVTDPVRQEYPWRYLAVESLKRGNLPVWNPYSFSGYPLLAGFQAATFNPFNIIFFVLPFPIGWSTLILLQPLLAGAFMYAFLCNKKLREEAAFLGSIAFAFCGFMIAWLEWGTVDSVALWLPLTLLSIDKVFQAPRSKIKDPRSKHIVWFVLFTFSLIAAFFAGHLQTFFYLAVLTAAYFLMQWWVAGKNKKVLLFFVLCFLFFVLITLIQWLPTLHFIFLSGRALDQAQWGKPGWFLPWQNLAQFIAPDFFGNPATLNYWGVWNYAEFVGYIGVAPLLLAFVSLFTKWTKDKLFFAAALLLALVFALPTGISALPYLFNLPLIATSQPTRLLFVVDFSLSVLAAYGLDRLLEKRQKSAVVALAVGAVVLGVLWAITLHVLPIHLSLTPTNLAVARHNLILPTALFVISAIILGSLIVFKNRNIKKLIVYCLLFIVFLDLLRFGDKFTPFTNASYLFPQDTLLSFLQSQPKPLRLMTTDDRILPPNFSAVYHLESVDGYDPLYPLRYAELIAAISRGKPDIRPPFGFNRIITPHTVSSPLINLLGAGYVLSFDQLDSPQFEKVYEEGQTKVYKNTKALPRVFFVPSLKHVQDKQGAIQTLFDSAPSLRTTAVVEGKMPALQTKYSSGSAKITQMTESSMTIETQNAGTGFLVILNAFYPGWHASLDMKEIPIYLTDYDFQGVVVPSGKHTVELRKSLW